LGDFLRESHVLLLMGNALTAESKTKLERLAAIQGEVKAAGRDVRRRLGRQHVKQRILDARMSMLMGNVVPHGAWVLEDKKQRLALDIARMREDTSMLNESLCMIDTAEDAIGKLIATEHNKVMLAGVARGLQRIEHYEQRIADVAEERTQELDFTAVDAAIESGAAAIDGVKSCIRRMAATSEEFAHSSEAPAQDQGRLQARATGILKEFETQALASESEQDAEMLQSLQRFESAPDRGVMSGV
jgi:hypothetical protein